MGAPKGTSEVIPLPASASPTATRERRVKKILVCLTVGIAWITFVHFRGSGACHKQQLATAYEDPETSWAFSYAARRRLQGIRAIKEFITIPNNDSALAASRLYASKPHIAGSPQDLNTAINVLELFQQEFGLPARKFTPIYEAGSPASRLATLTIPWQSKPQVWIDTYYPVLNTPLDRALELLDKDGKVVWSASLEEVADNEDADAGKYWASVPTFHGLSKGGDVSGPLIYANYGTKEDFDDLVEKGVDFTGAIVLVRYGRIFRGLKIKGAQERGAAGVLIYSDLRDDGSVTEENGYKPYPYGPARNIHSVQRGSVQFISMYPGDPTTPGYPSYSNVTRQEAISIPSIPSLPISWANAKRLLDELPTGADKADITVRLYNNVDDKVTPIWNTMAVVPGHIKDEIVLIGNHRDAWVLGATDPSSGTASMHEVIRGFAHLYRKGWRPLRTIVFASWDAEEYGLVGSTEWGEDFAHFVGKHVVAYLNLDSSVGGSRFHAAGSPSLANLLRVVAQHIPHPSDKQRSLWDARQDDGKLDGKVSPEVAAWHTEEEERLRVSKALATGVTPLGSGSDYTVFLQHIGIASTDGGFGGTLKDPVYHYHSIYDSQQWQEKYGDPGFHRHVAVSQFLGSVAISISDSIVLPINTTQYAFEFDTYLDRVENIAAKLDPKPDLTALRDAIANLQVESIKLDSEKKEAAEELKKLLRKGRGHRLMRKLKCKARRLQAWIATTLFGVPATAHPHWAQHEDVDEDLQGWLEAQGTSYREGVSPVRVHGKPEGMPVVKAKQWLPHHNPIKFIRAVRRVRAVNRKLAAFEKSFISEDGIKDREWYKHLVVAPGKWLGYGATTFPALTESLTIEKNITLAEVEAGRLAELFNKAAESLRA